MAVSTEAVHAAEHLKYDLGDYSRDQVTLASGQNLAAGTIVQYEQDSLTSVVVWDGTIDSTGGYDPLPAGVLYAAVDASGGAKPAVINARETEVYLSKITFPAGKQDNAIAGLKAIGIIVRDDQ